MVGRSAPERPTPGGWRAVLWHEGFPIHPNRVVGRRSVAASLESCRRVCARIVLEEPFGPIVPLLRFSDVDEVVRRANDSEFGLGGSVWSGDVEQARAIGARLETGTVWINSVQLLDPLSPFAGRKQSGIGVENGMEGLLEFTSLQTMVD